MLDRWFGQRIEETLLRAGYEKYGSGELESEILVALDGYFQRIGKEASSEIQWFKLPDSSPMDSDGNLTCNLSAIVTDEMGRVFRRMLTTPSMQAALVRHIEKNLTDGTLKMLFLTFEVWTPYHDDDRPFHTGKKGIVAKISLP